MTPGIAERADGSRSAGSLEGSCTVRFEPVASALRSIADAEPDAAFAVAAYLHGRPVVDLWANHAKEQSLFHTWSAVKPMVGTGLLLALDRARVPLNRPVREVWPSLRGARTSDMRVQHILAHAAGLVTVPDGDVRTLVDWEATVDGLESAIPDWEPGTAVGEHALTYGHLVGELIRRLDGRDIGTYLAEELADPLGLEVHVGVPTEDQHRIVDTQRLDHAYWERYRGDQVPLRRRALGGGMDDVLVNSPSWRSACVPAVNGHATARGLASFYARLLDGALPQAAADAGAGGTDRILGRPVVWSLAGGQLREGHVAMGGAGGQWAAGHPASGLAWAFVTSGMGDLRRAAAVEKTLVACVGTTSCTGALGYDWSGIPTPSQ